MTADDKDNEGFLARWSRLKQAPAKPAKPEDAVRTEPAEAKTAAPAEGDEDEKIDLADLPSIDSLTADSDFSAFLRKGVPEDLRQQALRKLWVCNPVVAATDVFDVYNLDYFNMPSFPEGVKTLFRVGHGMLDALEQEKERLADAGGPVQASAPEAGTDDDSPAADSEGKGDEAAERDGADERKPGEGRV